MAGWKTERTFAGKTADDIYRNTKRVIDELSGRYGLKHQTNDTALTGKVSRMGVDGAYRAYGDKVSIELDYGFLIPNAVRQKVQDEVGRRLDSLFA